MTDSTDSTIPLAAHRKALREAERAALTKLADRYRNAYLASPVAACETEAFRDQEFPEPGPEPEPELRWVQWGPETEGVALTRAADGEWFIRGKGYGKSVRYAYRDEDFRRAFSLLPREPVAVTDEIIWKAEAAFMAAKGDARCDWLRAALLAIAADLAGPVGEKPKATPDSDDLVRERKATNIALHALVWNKRSLRNVPGGWQVAPEYDDYPNASPPYCVTRESGGPIASTALDALLEWHRRFLAEHFPHASSSSEVADT